MLRDTHRTKKDNTNGSIRVNAIGGTNLQEENSHTENSMLLKSDLCELLSVFLQLHRKHMKAFILENDILATMSRALFRADKVLALCMSLVLDISVVRVVGVGLIVVLGVMKVNDGKHDSQRNSYESIDSGVDRSQWYGLGFG